MICKELCNYYTIIFRLLFHGNNWTKFFDLIATKILQSKAIISIWQKWITPFNRFTFEISIPLAISFATNKIGKEEAAVRRCFSKKMF